jgi:energy-coupling factor transporter ATP-binding protein EcfA2
MIESISLENFRCFGEETTIPLAPLTLIYGQNSSGKSTVIQAINLLKQTHEKAPKDTDLLPVCEGGYVDLGGFSDVCFDGQGSGDERRVAIKLELSNSIRYKTDDGDWIAHPTLASGGSPMGALFAEHTDTLYEKTTSLGYRLEFQRVPKNEEAFQLSAFNVFLNSDLEPVMSYTRDEAGMLARSFDRTNVEVVWRIFYKHREKIVEKCEKWAQKDNVNPDDAKRLKETACFFASDFSQGEFSEEMTKGRFRHILVNHNILVDDAASFTRYSPEDAAIIEILQLEEISSDPIAECHGFQTDAIENIPPFVDYYPGINVWDRCDPYFAEDTQGKRGEPKMPISLETVSGWVKQHIEDIYPLAPIRSAPERWRLTSGVSGDFVGYYGQWTQDILSTNSNACQHVSDWLDRFTGYQCASYRSTELSGLNVLQLRDTRRGESEQWVTPRDVGYGISQMLPLLTQCLIAKAKTLTIEQPEVHVHPKLQADLAELFAVSTLEHKNQLIIETHSEHLLLRVRRMIRNGKLKPSDVSLLYVERGDAGSTVRQLKINKHGVILDPWPPGFFPDAADELLGG